MRYERMGLAGVASAVCALIGCSFLSMAATAVRYASLEHLMRLESASVTAANLGLLGASLLCLALAFLCFALIKVQMPGNEGRLALLRFGQKLGWWFVSLAVFFGTCSVLTQVLRVLR